MNKEVLAGVGVVAFGIIVGGVGLATAGIGIGIPVIPIGIYIAVRGFSRARNASLRTSTMAFERSRLGRIGIGVVLIFVGCATSALLIGLPIIGLGGWLIFQGVRR